MKLKFILVSSIMLILIVLAYVDLNQKINRKTVVVNMDEMYHAFQMTQDMEKKYTRLSKNRGDAIDSLNTMIQKLQRTEDEQANPVLVNQKIQTVAYAQANLLQENETMKLELEQQIWTQLNEYLNQFGQEKNYAIILGAQSHGNVIYAEKMVDITNQAIEFINQKYQGIQ